MCALDVADSLMVGSNVWQLGEAQTRCACAGTDLKLAELLYQTCSVAAPVASLKSGDQLQVQRFTGLLHRLRASTAAATARHMRMQQERHRSDGAAARDLDSRLPDVPKRRPM